AAYQWAGRGDGKAADAAATEAMRSVLGQAPGCGTVVIGEGEKDGAPMLFNGERLGDGDGPQFDIAVDPVECTDLCAAGLPGALTTIAFAQGGTLWSPGPAHYMDKLVAGAPARAAVDLTDDPQSIVQRVAETLDKPVSEVGVIVLDKPRHAELVQVLREIGATVRTPSAGDVAGALLALMPGTGVDLLMGVGGTPEGVMTACAVQSLEGAMQGRLAPQGDAEAEAIRESGLSTTEILGDRDLARGPALFAACGVTGGDLLRAPWREGPLVYTESLLVCGGAVRWVVEATRADLPTA
ncbi:MAG: fructose-bisphosphatase class II family protein, partial [Solirubrobacterales bacterium]|nr:fructose-bisphosphatase class II family protein [Solirubrobacterales bacterium]